MIYVLLIAMIRFVIGIFGNALVIYVYQFQTTENIQGFFISVLAVCDMISSSLLATINILKDTKIIGVYTALCKAYSFIFGLLSFMSSLLLLVIAIDRYLRICKNNPICSKWGGRVVIVVISVSFISALPHLFTIKDTIVKTQRNSSDNFTVSICEISDEDRIRHCLPVLVLCIGIITALVILYGRIILTINAHFKRIETSLTAADIWDNSEINNTQNEQKSEFSRRNILVMKKTIGIFIAISVTFFLSYIPFLITSMFQKRDDEIRYVISRLLFNISSSINPFIYAFMDVRFRKEAKLLMTKTFQKCGLPCETYLCITNSSV